MSEDLSSDITVDHAWFKGGLWNLMFRSEEGDERGGLCLIISSLGETTALGREGFL